MKRILLIFCILTGLFDSHAQGTEAGPGEIFENAVRSLSLNNARMQMTMKTTDQKGNSKIRELQSTFASVDDTKQVMIEITAPDNLKGTKVLSTHRPDEQGVVQLYMPSTGKTRKFRANRRNLERMGNNIPIGHFTTNSYAGYKAISIGKEQLDGTECHKIHLRPEGEENTYGIAFVTVENKQLVRIEQYDQNAQITGLTELSEYQATNVPGNKLYPRQINIRKTNSSESTEITITGINPIPNPEELNFKMPEN